MSIWINKQFASDCLVYDLKTGTLWTLSQKVKFDSNGFDFANEVSLRHFSLGINTMNFMQDNRTCQNGCWEGPRNSWFCCSTASFFLYLNSTFKVWRCFSDFLPLGNLGCSLSVVDFTFKRSLCTFLVGLLWHGGFWTAS